MSLEFVREFPSTVYVDVFPLYAPSTLESDITITRQYETVTEQRQLAAHNVDLYMKTDTAFKSGNVAYSFDFANATPPTPLVSMVQGKVSELLSKWMQFPDGTKPVVTTNAKTFARSKKHTCCRLARIEAGCQFSAISGLSVTS